MDLSYSEVINSFVISDTHFFHKNIGRYCNRPEGWMGLIIENWNKVVGEEDIVIHLGDLAFGHIDLVSSITKNLKGRKFLLKGNHDNRSKTWFGKVGFTLIKEPFTVKKGPVNILLSHWPKYDIPVRTTNIHGHIHNNGYFRRVNRDNSFINVSVERIHYTPVKVRHLIYGKEEIR